MSIRAKRWNHIHALPYFAAWPPKTSNSMVSSWASMEAISSAVMATLAALYLSIEKSTLCYVENRHSDSEHPDAQPGTLAVPLHPTPVTSCGRFRARRLPLGRPPNEVREAEAFAV